IAGSNNSIGGSASAAGNTIANNLAGGILVQSGSGDKLSHNLIYTNGSSQQGPGIVVDSGANNNLAAPVLSTATYNSTTQMLTVTGKFTAPTGSVPYVLEFFANPTGDPEGQVFLGRIVVTPKAAGTRSFTFKVTTSVVVSDPLITATLTDATGDTSAFSVGVLS
ncbi:MAG TPA: hypothetical protein VKU02_12505, partial [Gemmataceae bacterium]|nr:hypothetical protein [Gemmataceae bacterium]